jgi:2-(1,2-epoxy-1,2-dihydrophenyl)acetyl-CoA isomerase
MADEILFDRQDGVAWITFNRASVKNALTKAMCAELVSIVNRLRDDRETRVIVFRGNGADFTAGADLKDVSKGLSTLPAERGAEVAAMARSIAWPIFLGIHELRQPIVASVRGHVIGVGVQVVLSADLTVASETARFLLPQVKLGHPVDHGESYYLPRKIGLARTMQLTLLAETWSAAEADKHNLVNWVVSDSELEKKTEQVVLRLARGAAVALYETKALVRDSARRTVAEQFAEEAYALERCAATEDFPEAIAAFIEKRAPLYKGR